MKLKKDKPLIVWYHGGFYPGCAWEPNAIFWNGTELVGVLCTGRDGLFGKLAYPQRTQQELVKYVQSAEFEEEQEPLFFEPDHEGISEMFKDYREDFCVHVCAELGLEVPCSLCHCWFDPEEATFEGYRGDGGIGIISEGVMCSECRAAGECCACNEYVGKDELDAGGRCEWCAKKTIKLLPEEDQERLEQIEEDLNRIDDVVARMKVARPESAERYAQQGEKIKQKLNAEKRELLYGR